MNSKKLLFIGKTVPKHLICEYNNRTTENAMANAAIKFEDKIIEGLEENLQSPIDLFNVEPVYSFPRYYKSPIIQASFFHHIDSSFDYNAGFLNVRFIKSIFLSLSLLVQFKKYYNIGKQDRIVVYSLDLNFLKLAKEAKKDNKRAKIVAIVPDMPEFNDLSNNIPLLLKLYNGIQSKKVRSYLQYIDAFVFMTQQSAKYLINEEKPYCIVEGICDEVNRNEKEIEGLDSTNKIVMYTGTLHEKYGILNLVEAFKRIKDDSYRLFICGQGDSVNRIKEEARIDSRIKYCGVLTIDEIREMQTQATVLVNPRQNIGEYTKYSFPSKNIEYLSSGKPVIAYKLDGIGDEYDDYFIYCDDNSIQCLKEKIVQVCTMDDLERKNIGKRNQDFVRLKKNKQFQTRKILNLFDEGDLDGTEH